MTEIMAPLVISRLLTIVSYTNVKFQTYLHSLTINWSLPPSILSVRCIRPKVNNVLANKATCWLANTLPRCCLKIF